MPKSRDGTARMLSIDRAETAADFELAERFARALGEWDGDQVGPLGYSREEVIEAFHGETAATLAATYLEKDAGFLIARWSGTPAGCIAFRPFDERIAEIHKF